MEQCMMLFFAQASHMLFLGCFCLETGEADVIMVYKLGTLINLHADKAWTLVEGVNTIAQKTLCKAYLTLRSQTFHIRSNAVILVHLLRV